MSSKWVKRLKSRKALIDLGMRETLYALGSELLDIKRCHHRTEDHGATQRALVKFSWLAR